MRRAAIPGLATLVVLRLPSLMEPHWYTDEAGYVNVARELLKGRILYAQIWNNKPPGMLWTIALEVQLFGSSEIGLHLLTLISGMTTLAAVVWAAGRLYTPRRALLAGVIVAVILGLPIVDAELAVPESLMIAPLSWAGAIILVRILRGDGSAG
ncbi:MAG: glycosyltransferase family 39 protein, partial [Candidatus Dormiibacterota bacterium]